MKITKTLNGTVLNVALEGRLDTLTAPDLEKEILSSLDGITEVDMDFAELEYISSAGLRALLAIQREVRGANGMHIRNANEIVKEVFDVTGFSDILDIR